jgi:hypothetical protein
VLPEFRAGVCYENPVTQLLAFLSDPARPKWKTYVQGLFGVHITSEPKYSSQDISDFEKGLEQGESLPEIPAATKSSDNRIAFLQRADFSAFSVSALLEDLGQQKMDAFRVKLALRDEWECRANGNFRESWRAVLATWNLAQFHPGVQVTCHTAAAGEASDKPVVAEAPMETKTPEVRDFPKEAGLELLDESCLHFRDAMERGELPLGICGDPIMKNGRVVAEAELAWPKQKVAVVLEEADLDICREQGWTAFLPEQLNEVKNELEGMKVG